MIGLMDCNNFFVSCERLFRPDLLKRPVAVLSSNDGCIVARSEEVKALDIPMGIPYFEVRDICKKHSITLFSSNFPLYRDISARVMHALTEEYSNCEIYSVDEAFFEIESKTDDRTVHAIRERIMRKTGIPVSFGIADTKTIAKVASTYAKKGTGVCIMDKERWKSVQPEIICGKVWQIGRQTTKKLTEMSIATVQDFLTKDPAFFRNEFGVMGERLFLELTGTSIYQVGLCEESAHQSIASTRSFHTVVHELSVLESALGYHVAHVGEKLREQGLAARVITIIVAPGRFTDYGHRRGSVTTRLTEPTNDTKVLLSHALSLLKNIFDSKIPYKKAGFIAGGILPEQYLGGSLFGETTTKEVYGVADALNQRFGPGTIRPGVVLQTEKWRERSTLRSKEYTTQWGEIAKVKAT